MQLRSSRVRSASFAQVLMAGLLTGAGAGTAVASTADRGPGAAIAAIRHDLPLLLAAPLEDTRVRPTIDWVVADNKETVAMWYAGKDRGVVALRLRSRQWWWRGAAATEGTFGWTEMQIPGNEVTSCGSTFPGPPSAHDLLVKGFIDKALADELSHRLQPTTIPKSFVKLSLCDPDQSYVESWRDSYAATFFYKEPYYYEWWFRLSGGTPADSQKAAASGAQAYYSFALSAEPKPRSFYQVAQPVKPTPLPSAVTFARGATFAVWFPYVLSKDRYYTLDLKGGASRIFSLSGRLKNNVLHFDLPQFTWQLRHAAYGEIDGARVTKAVATVAPTVSGLPRGPIP